MTTYSTSRGASLERAYRHWRERGVLLNLHLTENVTSPVTIAISRESGAGGGAIAHAIAKQLDWPVYDRELVETIAEDSGVSAKLLDRLDEKLPNWLTECMSGFTSERSMSGVGFAIRLRKVLLALYCHGNCVILGRGAAQVLPAKQTLRVRLIAPKPTRIQRATNRLGIREDAERQVAEIDRGRVDFVKSYFHKDPADVHGYDLIIDTSRFSEPDCGDLILAALKARQGLIQHKQ